MSRSSSSNMAARSGFRLMWRSCHERENCRSSPILVLFGWYLVVMCYMDASAAASGAAAT
jgi:hypothetical protein